MNYKQYCLQKLLACSFLTFISTPVHAQITPDKTLPNNSKIKLEGKNSIIEGGTKAGSNLFHSFQEFSVPTGGKAHFNNAVDISNIISRVTGKSISEIDGLIKANGSANLFLINPNGIVFGKNASLDIGGSFVGSTANSLKFADGKEFSASKPQTTALLSIDVPLGLQYGPNSGKIRNQSQATNSQGETVGLQVKPGETLGLIGGDVSFEAGKVSAAGARVELGGLKGAGTVGLSGDGNNLSFDFPVGVERSDISLSNGSTVDVANEGNGKIAISSRNFELTGKSSLDAGLTGLGSINTKAGNIEINATEAIDLKEESKITNFVADGITAQGGDINLKTGNLSVKDGSQVIISGNSQGGNLTVDAQDVQLIGGIGGIEEDIQFFRASGLFNQTNSDSPEDSGDLKIKTNTLLVQDGANVSTITLGKGKGGNVTIDAQDVQLIGTSKDGEFSSKLSSRTNPNSLGDAGDLMINTNTLLVQDGANVSTSTQGIGKGGNLTIDAKDVQVTGVSKDSEVISGLFSSAERDSTGDAGDLIVKTNTLLVQNGARVSASTSGAGNGGKLIVNAQDVQLVGRGFDGEDTSSLSAKADIRSTGDAGDLSLTTGRLLVKDGALISVRNLEKGVAGDLNINADSVQLDNGRITASTSSSNGGNIKLEIADLLLMRNNSQISSNAGLEEQPGNGGNIDINIPDGFVVATHDRNNDISANAFEGNGGRVNINATSIFGMILRSREDLVRLLGTDDPSQLDPRQLPTNDITAISQQNPFLSGTVGINTLQTEADSGLVKLPTIPVETKITQTCSNPGYAQSSFTIVGRDGSLPPSYLDPLVGSGSLTQTKLATLQEETKGLGTIQARQGADKDKEKQKQEQENLQIVQAQGWVKTKSGKIILVAQVPQANFSSNPTASSCPTSNSQYTSSGTLP